MPEPPVAFLDNAMAAAWQDVPSLRQYGLQRDATERFWNVFDGPSKLVAAWRSVPFPSCNILVITRDVLVQPDYRGRGLGRAMRLMRLDAYRRAGFQAELCTVRADNAVQQHIMAATGGVIITAMPSRAGGMVHLFLTRMDNPYLTPLTGETNA